MTIKAGKVDKGGHNVFPSQVLKRPTPPQPSVKQPAFDRDWLEDRVEPIARMMAAEKMDLTKDKLGKNQPYNLWSQCIPEACKFLGLD